jgi:hypothetical protein
MEMLDAMRDGDLAVARERALSLRDWLERGGFYPQDLSRETVRSNLADVLRQTQRRDHSDDSD